MIYTAKNETVKILHTGDTHIGSRQYHSDIRRRDYFESFEKVIVDAIENEMDAVVHAGDLFDNRNPTIEDLLETIFILTKLKKAKIPFFGIVGNHESKQNTQWLDIFETMGLTKRLGSRPVILENEKIRLCFYGIDNLSAPRLSSFDFSVFEQDGAQPAESGDRKVYNILTLHQLLSPILPGQPLSCDDFTRNIPISFDVILLGDNHKYECIKHNGAWLTYSGSTERCSMAEEEPRSYNILTFEETESVITRRTIPTRDFVVIKMTDSENDMRSIFEKIDSYSEKIKDAVVFVELSGIKKTLLSVSEIEEYVKNKGAAVARIGDKRDLERKENDRIERIVFRDPDEVVTQELKKLNLTEAGLLMDRIIRDTDTAKSRIDDESETRLKTFLGSREFTEEYKRESPGLFLEEPEFTGSAEPESKDEETKTEKITEIIRNFRVSEFDETDKGQSGEKEKTAEAGQDSEKEKTAKAGQGGGKEKTAEAGQGSRKEKTAEAGQGGEKEKTAETGQGGEKEKTAKAGQGGEKEKTAETGQGGEKEKTAEAGQGGEKEKTAEAGQGGEKEKTAEAGQGGVKGEEGEPEEALESNISENGVDRKPASKKPYALKKEEATKSAPRQYTLGDMFGREDEK